MEELELKKQQHQLDQVKLMIDEQKAQQDAQLNVYDHKMNLEKSRITHSLDRDKVEMEYTHRFQGLLCRSTQNW